MITACGSEFPTDGAENWQARLEKSVEVSNWTSSGMADEGRVILQANHTSGPRVGSDGLMAGM